MLTDTSMVYSSEQEIARVVVGLHLDASLMNRMKSQTDMEHLLWMDEVILATNLPSNDILSGIQNHTQHYEGT